ncbi:hypothetical protein AB1Y20_020575 [Prymnesium parvum]|uniref:Gamma-glutamyltransferase n=1 Tax=Prymnesium parvum TaxID=97485 RepID=A0AB34JXT7_PRYPA
MEAEAPPHPHAEEPHRELTEWRLRPHDPRRDALLPRPRRHPAVWLLLAYSLAITIAVFSLAAAGGGSCPPSPPQPLSRVARGTSGAVAADHPSCSRMGLDRLKEGGNAVDAAVSTALCLGVVRPEGSGLGGGAFLLIRRANGSAEVIDAREEAPASAYETMYLGSKSGLSLRGGLAVAVPAELSGLHLAWKRHGQLPWASLVLPVAELAEGFVVDRVLASALKRAETDLASSFYAPGGRVPTYGEVFRNPRLAATLRQIARDPLALSHGALAHAIVEEVAAAGGNLTMHDLANYEPVIRQPLQLTVDGLTLLGVPPPSSGGATVLQALLYLSVLQSSSCAVSSVVIAHRVVEALKHAFALRMNLGDPAFVADAARVVDAMLSASFNLKLAANSSDWSTRPLHEYGGQFNQLTGLPSDGGTSHFSIVDSDRNAVAVTTTINTYFGSKVVSDATGIVFNNEMDDFSTPGQPNAYGLAPSEANFIVPGKRPLSSMSPTIVLQDGLVNGSVTSKVRAVIGASGGPRIITSVLQVLVNVLLRGVSAEESVKSPRLHHQFIPNVVHAEDWEADEGSRVIVPPIIIDGLRQRGHVVARWQSHGVAQLVLQNLDTGELEAVSDVRKDGIPSAYSK